MPRGFQKGPLWAFFHRSDTKPDGSIHFQATHWRCIEALRPKDEPSHVEGSLPLIENAHWFPEALANAIANELDVPGVKKYMIEHLRNCPHATPQEQTQGAEAQNKPAVSRNFRPVLDDEYRPIKRRRLQTDEILPANIDTHFPSTSASATSSFPVSSSESSSLSLSNSFSVSFSHVSQLSSSSNAALGAAGFGLALGLLPTTSSPANGFSSLSFARSIPTSRPVSSTEFTNATSGPLQLSGYTLLGSSFARPGPSSHLSSPTKHLSSINTFSSNSVQSDHQGRAQPNPQHRATLLPFVIHNSQEATSGALKENGKKRARKAQPPPSEFLRNAEGITSKEQAPPTKKMSSSCWVKPSPLLRRSCSLTLIATVATNQPGEADKAPATRRCRGVRTPPTPRLGFRLRAFTRVSQRARLGRIDQWWTPAGTAYAWWASKTQSLSPFVDIP
ncbi:hypothetical protein C8R46DRAFT_450326 [Mycena filopes]|nr:hypothetical protein C8R46DRAFT_450326 [Mycena filopes]